MIGFVFGLILGVLVGIGAAGLMTAAGDDIPRWLHPPNDDDGVTRMEDDPDGEYTR